MAKSFGINTDRMELMGLVISNGIIALSGALMAQQEGYADASRGIGVIVIGLASLIIGEVLFSNVTLTERLLSVAVGSIAYQFLIWAVIALGINTSYIRIFSALILAICLMIPTFKEKSWKERNSVNDSNCRIKKCNQSCEQWDEWRKVILDDVSLEIREHDFITILGGNGAGKSTPL